MRTLAEIKAERGNGKTWCAPTAMSRLLGVPYAEAERLIRQQAPDRHPKGKPITGVYPDTYLSALERAGVRMKLYPLPPTRPTLLQWGRLVAGLWRDPGWWLVSTRGHVLLAWVTYDGAVQVYDNRWDGQPATGKRNQYGRDRVRSARKIIEAPGLEVL